VIRRSSKASADQRAGWRAFVSLFLKVFIGGTAGVYLFVLMLDPYDVVPFSLPMERRIFGLSQRHMYPQIVRSGRYDSLLVGTSTARLLDPEVLDRSFGVRSANLAMDSATAWEQYAMIDYFLRRAGAPKLLIVALDTVWCEHDADRNRVTFRGFPEWLYDDNPWNDYLYLLNSETVRIAGRLFRNKLGIYQERMRGDGYAVFVPPEQAYDPAKAHAAIWEGRTPQILPDIEPPPLSPEQRSGLSFPALAWLDDALARLPQSSEKVLAFMPVHVAAQPRPGTLRAAIEAECKARIADVARRRAAKVVDWRIASALTRNDSNYWDSLHYRVPIATRIAQQLGLAVRSGRESEDGSYRLVVR
jgi:hypothetical protein